jgi:hypothetical protein
MKTIFSAFILASLSGVIMLGDYRPSSTSAVALIGGVIKARHNVSPETKYPRKDCPVCKGEGWYISGDGIEKVDCGYCVPDKGTPEPTQLPDPPLVPVEPLDTFYLRK